MPRSAPEIIATVFVNSHRLVIDSLRNLKENRKMFKEKSHPCGGSFLCKNSANPHEMGIFGKNGN